MASASCDVAQAALSGCASASEDLGIHGGLPARRRSRHDGRMAALVRPRTGRVIGGVCAAIANRFEMSATIIRVLMVGSILFFGLSIGLYLILWVLIPLERP